MGHVRPCVAWRLFLLSSETGVHAFSTCVRECCVHSPGFPLPRILQISGMSWHSLASIILEKLHSSLKNLKPASWIHKFSRNFQQNEGCSITREVQTFWINQTTCDLRIKPFSYQGRSTTEIFFFFFFPLWWAWYINLKSLYATASLFHRVLKEWSNRPCLYFIICQALSNNSSHWQWNKTTRLFRSTVLIAEN